MGIKKKDIIVRLLQDRLQAEATTNKLLKQILDEKVEAENALERAEIRLQDANSNSEIRALTDELSNLQSFCDIVKMLHPSIELDVLRYKLTHDVSRPSS